MKSYADTNTGLVRSENEDSFVLHVPNNGEAAAGKGALAIVADGVGGGPDGKRASSMAVNIVLSRYYDSVDEDPSSQLLSALQHANDEIYHAARHDRPYGGMATTCTALALVDGSCYLCHAGDSRAYLLHAGELRRMSKDHTLVEDMVDDGIISKEEAAVHPQRNIILKALGSKPYIVPDIETFPVEPGDTILLCSDGLYGYISDAEIARELLGHQVAVAGKNLMNLALLRGGVDNITLVILNI